MCRIETSLKLLLDSSHSKQPVYFWVKWSEELQIDYFFIEIHQESGFIRHELDTVAYGYDYMGLEKHWIRETAENPNKIISFAATNTSART